MGFQELIKEFVQIRIPIHVAFLFLTATTSMFDFFFIYIKTSLDNQTDLGRSFRTRQRRAQLLFKSDRK